MDRELLLGRARLDDSRAIAFAHDKNGQFLRRISIWCVQADVIKATADIGIAILEELDLTAFVTSIDLDVDTGERLSSRLGVHFELSKVLNNIDVQGVRIMRLDAADGARADKNHHVGVVELSRELEGMISRALGKLNIKLGVGHDVGKVAQLLLNEWAVGEKQLNVHFEDLDGALVCRLIVESDSVANDREIQGRSFGGQLDIALLSGVSSRHFRFDRDDPINFIELLTHVSEHLAPTRDGIIDVGTRDLSSARRRIVEEVQVSGKVVILQLEVVDSI
jgi:hypothetical protein